MNQRISVLGLIFSILVSVENSTTLQNVLLSKPLNSINSKTNMKKKFNISESNNYNFKTVKQKILNDSEMNNAVAVPKLIKGKYLLSYPKKSRFPRQVQKKFDTNNQKESYERPYKVLLDIKPENQEDYYDNYDYDKYYNYQGRNIKGLVDDWNLSSEVEKNSKPITKTLCESQERKRCSIMKSVLDSKKIQQPQKLVSQVIDDRGRKPELRCRDCKLLKPNASPVEPKISNIKTTRIKQINDDYFITILKQLIDKLDKSKNLKTSDDNNNYHPILKSSEPNILENKPVEQRALNDSSEEEWILKLEKMKRNRIMDKLDSSPERTYVNGKWLKKQIAAVNKKNDCEPVVNEFSGVNGKNESISSINNDTKQLNLTNAENPVPESDDVTTTIFYSLPTTASTQEIKEVSTLPLPVAENEYSSVSRETVKPLYLSSAPINELDAAMIDENEQLLKSTTTEVGKSNFSNAEENYTRRDESTAVSNTHTTPKESTSESYNALNVQSLNRIFEPSADVHRENVNLKKTNHSEGVENANELAGSFEKDSNDSLENNCDCNKKVIKNILSSTMISNITEIKTDTYRSPATRTKTKSHKRSDRKLTNSGVTTEAFSSPSKIGEEKPKVNALPAVSTLVIDGDRSPDKMVKNERNAKPLLKQLLSSSAKGASLKPETLKFENLKKNNLEEKTRFYTDEDIKSKTKTPENSRRVNYSTRFVAKLRPVHQKTGTDFEKHDELNTNKNVFTVSKNSGQTPRKAVIARTTIEPPRSAQNVTVTAKLKNDFPKNSRTRAGKNVGEKTVIVDDIAAMTKKPFSAAVKSSSRPPTAKTVRKPSKVKSAVETPRGKIDDKKKFGSRNDGNTAFGSRKPVQQQQQQSVMTEENVGKTEKTSKKPTKKTADAADAAGSNMVNAKYDEKPTDGEPRVLNDQRQTSTPRYSAVRGTERNLKKADRESQKSKLADQDRRFDAEHGPYRAEDLVPITFDGPAKNAAGWRPIGWLQSPASGQQQQQQQQEETQPRPVQFVRPVPEYYDDDDDDDYDAAPLVPIETSDDGRRATAVSLTELLTGGVRLRGEYNASSSGETLLAGALREIGGAVPVQIVQIINNGACLTTCQRPSRNGTETVEKSRSGGKRVQQLSPTRLRSAAPAVKQLEKAYDHFDSEILNKFLQVYAPPHEV